MPVAGIEFRVNVHATEDKEKVLRALKNILGDYWELVEVEEEEYSGHYGNPIRVLRVRIRGPRAGEVLDYVLSRLSRGDRQVLSASLEDRVDKEGTLYFRLSKQDAFLGRLIVYEADDVVRVSVSFHGRRKDALSDYRGRLEEEG